MKTCSKCKIVKELTEFSKDQSTKDKLCSYCKSCDRKNYRERYHAKKLPGWVPKVRSRGTRKAIDDVISSYKHCAKKRDMEWKLSDQEAEVLVQSNCHYCSCPPSNRKIYKSTYNYGKHLSTYIYGGIDRVDSSLGYTSGNVVPCCSICNIAKRALSVTDFLAHAKKIAQHNSKLSLPPGITNEFI